MWSRTTRAPWSPGSAPRWACASSRPRPRWSFLEGAGFLAEATDHGPPGAGRFWSQALAWPLVWEQGLQTAIQHPSGGTKLSWDIRDQDTPYGSKQQWLHLVADDVDDERARLVGLGALRVEADEDALVMTDPGGNRFTLSPA